MIKYDSSLTWSCNEGSIELYLRHQRKFSHWWSGQWHPLGSLCHKACSWPWQGLGSHCCFHCQPRSHQIWRSMAPVAPEEAVAAPETSICHIGSATTSMSMSKPNASSWWSLSIFWQEWLLGTCLLIFLLLDTVVWAYLWHSCDRCSLGLFDDLLAKWDNERRSFLVEY